MNSSNQIPSEMEYIKYMNLGFFSTTVLCHITTIFFTFHVIYCSKFDKKSTKLDRISNSFFIFLACRGFGAVLATPYYVYMTAYWSAEDGQNYERMWPKLRTVRSLVVWTRNDDSWKSLYARNCQHLACVLLKYRFLVPQYAKFCIDCRLLACSLYQSATKLSLFSQCCRLFRLLFVAIDEKIEWVLDKNLSCPSCFSSYYSNMNKIILHQHFLHQHKHEQPLL
ncbi:hypothetical protein DdX_16371 [Ditylenchus destructor]|uniref:Uncharacterized protein n=1 Tax=Ditylenchus destructor TaxID=166010 RepID=A0AAD4MNX8_9BILA|nr:hypothetical protein DdX_16371 [Ditylenchus destructor]